MRAHLLQMDLAWEDRNANVTRARSMIAEAGVEPGDLVVLPEMFDTGFSFRTERTNDAEGRTLAALSELARETGAWIHGSRTLVHDDGFGRNLATVVSPEGRIVCEYAKIHPFTYGREAERFRGGEDVRVWQFPLNKTPQTPAADTKTHEMRADSAVVCPAICYDLRFPELFRHGLGMGAEVFVLGANWPAARAGHWRALLIARGIENQALVLGVNRCGNDPHLAYSGGTIAVGPKGEILGELGDEPGVLSIGFDIEAVRAWRREFPAWRDLRLMRKPS